MNASRKTPGTPAQRGRAAPAREFTPRNSAPHIDTPQPAPAHGTPGGPAQLERLKRRARDVPLPPCAPAQDEDERR